MPPPDGSDSTSGSPPAHKSLLQPILAPVLGLLLLGRQQLSTGKQGIDAEAATDATPEAPRDPRPFTASPVGVRVGKLG